TLEPCNHTGKTGPCAQALIAAGISKVVYASSDPGSVSGNGSETLRAAGIEVVGGFMKEVAEEQSRIWLTANRLKRPFVTVKWASSLDGRAAANDGSSKWISGEQSRADVHLRRSRADAILVGTGTVLADDPELTARKPDGSLYETQPLRVILGKTKVAESFRIFNHEAKTVHIETQDVEQALAALWDQGIKHVFVEGGPKVASSFIAAGFADEILIYLAPMLIGGSRTAIAELGVNTISEAIQLEVLENKSLGKDIFIRAKLGGM
ncbi:MAG: bifunctional diaminohydroxyphosphoribosylaminopyrimidine, partial [Actinomycetota bacterium]